MVPGEDASLTFIGNATVLLRACGFTVLTDPNFLHAGQRAHLGWGLTARRLLDPALGVDALPELDAVVLSHAHGDHWDREARRGLDHALPVLTTRHGQALLRSQGFGGAVGLATWEAHRLHRGDATLTVTSLPGRHAPGRAQLLLPPVMGSLLDFSTGGELRLRVYLSGDTLLVDALREIPRSFPDIDVGVVHLGGTTLPGGLVVTLDGEGGADLVDLLRPDVAVPVHYDDYPVFRSPLSDFTAAAQRRGLAPRVRVVGRGQTLALPLRPIAPRPA